MVASFLPAAIGGGFNLASNILGGSQANRQQQALRNQQITSALTQGLGLELQAQAQGDAVLNNLALSPALQNLSLEGQARAGAFGLNQAAQLDILNNASNQYAAGRNLETGTISNLFNAGVGTQTNINNTQLGIENLAANIVGTTAQDTAARNNQLYSNLTGANITSNLSDQDLFRQLASINQTVNAQTQNTRTGAQAATAQQQGSFDAALSLSQADSIKRSIEQANNQLGGSYQTKAATEGGILTGDAGVLQGLQRDASGGELQNLLTQNAAQLERVKQVLATSANRAGVAAESRATTRRINDQANALERKIANESLASTKNLSDQGRLAALTSNYQSRQRTRELSDIAGLNATNIGAQSRAKTREISDTAGAGITQIQGLSQKDTRAVNDAILANTLADNRGLQVYRQQTEDALRAGGINLQNQALLNEANVFQTGVAGLAQQAGQSAAGTRTFQDQIGATSSQQAGQSEGKTREIADQTQSTLAGLAGQSQADIRKIAEQTKQQNFGIKAQSEAESRAISDRTAGAIGQIGAQSLADTRAKEEEARQQGYLISQGNLANIRLQEEKSRGERASIADRSTARTREIGDLTRGQLAGFGGQSQLTTRQIADTTRGNVRTIADQTISRTQQTGDTAQASTIQQLAGARLGARTIEDQSSAASRAKADASKARTREIYDLTQSELAKQKALGERNIAEIDAQAYAADWGRRQGFNRALAGAALFS